MQGHEAKRARRKLRARTAPKPLAETALAVTSACTAAAAGLELCARRTRDETIAVAAKSAAEFLHALVDSTIALAAKQGIDARPRARTCDRLRWEWLASTATMVDGTPDGRLLAECARILARSDVGATGNVEQLGEGIAARLRVASAEAYSLASALRHERRGELALALT